MRISKTASGGIAVALGAALALSACGSKSTTPGTNGSNGSSSKAPALGAGDPHTGGTLKIVGEDDNGNYDPNGMYDTNSYSLGRLYARQLYSNLAGNSSDVRSPVQADAADGMPTISSDGLTYTVKIKSGIKWDDGTTVTAADFARGLKALCNPVDVSTAPASYLPSVLTGMKDYCDGFGKVSATDAAAMAAYNEKDVSGITAVDDSTIKFTLLKPAGDFVHILTLGAMSAREKKENDYIPESPAFRQHLVSDGPYKISSYVPDKSVALVRNTSWDASTDVVRKAYVDQITVTLGLSQDAIQQQIQAGSADMALGNEAVPTTALAQLQVQKSPQLSLQATGGYNPYIIFNYDTTNAAHASDPVKKQAVRQALEYAVNKAAIVQVLGGKDQPAGQIFPQSVVGTGWQKSDPYSTPNSAGDAAKAKQLLAAAGYPNGFTLKFAYRTNGNGPKIYAKLVDAFSAAGVKIEGVPIAGKQYYSTYMPSASNRTSEAWDIAEPGWGPDWEGTSERSFFTPLLDGRATGSNNFGHYNNDDVNKLADAALAETDQSKAAADWNTIDADIMKDAPWIPIIENVQANYFGSRVRNFLWDYQSNQGDYANVAVQ